MLKCYYSGGHLHTRTVDNLVSVRGITGLGLPEGILWMLDCVSLCWALRAFSQVARIFLPLPPQSPVLPLWPATWPASSFPRTLDTPWLSWNPISTWEWCEKWICSNTRDPIQGLWLILNLGEKSLAQTQKSLQYFIVMEKACTGTGVCSLCQRFFCLFPCEGKSHWV